jgi:antitoxin CptB
MASQNEAGDDLPLRRRRLRYRAWHRGTRELDLLLGPYTDARSEGLDAGELGALERLLSEDDTDLQDWLLGRLPAPVEHQALIAHIRAFRQTTPFP